MDKDKQTVLFDSNKFKRGVYREPFYSNQSDFNTNSKSYYDYLARFNGFISELVDFVNDLAINLGKYNNHSYYINIETLDAIGDDKHDNTALFETLGEEQIYYVPHGTYRTEFIPNGLFFGWGNIKYKNEIIPLSRTSPQKVRVNIDKTTEERYQSLIIGQNAGTKVADHAYSMTGVGYSVFKENIHGRRLTAFGKGALSNMTYGYSNVGLGSDALGQGTFGQRNVAIGDNALKWGGTTNAIKTLHDYWKNKGSQNFINSYFLPKYPDIWKYLGSENSPSSFLYPIGDADYKENVAIGRNALLHSMNGKNNVAIGYNSQAHTMRGNGNTSVGDRSLRDNIAGSRNTATGMYALTNNITGKDNAVFGANAAQQTLHASNNTVFGYGAMHFFKDDKNKNTDETYTYGYRNTAIGAQSMQDGKNASYCTFLGNYSGLNVQGNFNVGVGSNAMQKLTTGVNNVGIGAYSNRVLDKGSYNVALGYSAGPNGDFSNTVSIGNNAHAKASNQIQLGTDKHTVYAYKPVETNSDKKYKNSIEDTKLGLDFIEKLRPVDYFYNGDDKQRHGLIAQEVSDLGEFGGVSVNKDENNEDSYSIAYTELIAPLIKSVQDLSKTVKEQQKEIDELKEKLK